MLMPGTAGFQLSSSHRSGSPYLEQSLRIAGSSSASRRPFSMTFSLSPDPLDRVGREVEMHMPVADEVSHARGLALGHRRDDGAEPDVDHAGAHALIEAVDEA